MAVWQHRLLNHSASLHVRKTTHISKASSLLLTKAARNRLFARVYGWEKCRIDRLLLAKRALKWTSARVLSHKNAFIVYHRWSPLTEWLNSRRFRSSCRHIIVGAKFRRHRSYRWLRAFSIFGCLDTCVLAQASSSHTSRDLQLACSFITDGVAHFCSTRIFWLNTSETLQLFAALQSCPIFRETVVRQSNVKSGRFFGDWVLRILNWVGDSCRWSSVKVIYEELVLHDGQTRLFFRTGHGSCSDLAVRTGSCTCHVVEYRWLLLRS